MKKTKRGGVSMYSYTSLKLAYHCSKLYEHYAQTKQAFLDSDFFDYGRHSHQHFQDRIIEHKPMGDFEKQILVMADDWLYEYEISRESFHGVLDLYSISRNIAIEYKLNRYDPLQLDLYAWLIDGEVYLYREGKELTKHEPNPERLEHFINTALKNIRDGSIHLSMLCSQCVLAHVCEFINEKANQGDLDARLLLAENYKQRARLLEDIETDTDTETEYYKITVSPTLVYKLKRGVNRQELVKQIISDGKIHLLEFTPAKLKDEYPELVQEELRKMKKIEKRE